MKPGKHTINLPTSNIIPNIAIYFSLQSAGDDTASGFINIK